MLIQVYHPYWLWEDYKNGMWRKESKEYEKQWLPIAIAFTGDHIKYGAAMTRVVNEWPVSSEHNLTNLNINRRAWVGHAAVCLELGIPEYIVRTAWKNITQYQRVMANHVADQSIHLWHHTYVHGKKDVTRKGCQMKLMIQ